MKYAMLLDNRVIDIVDSEISPQYPSTNDGIAIEAMQVADDANVELGMCWNAENGEFYTPGEDGAATQIDVMHAKLNETADVQLVIMEAMADQYEQWLSQEIDNMDTQATIYEAILELGGI